MHHFKFSFPSDTKSLPKACRYEILHGNVGLIQTNDEQMTTALNSLCHKRVGQIRATTADGARELIGTTKAIDEITTVPSFTKQTKWPCGLFNFPESHGTCFLNPGLELWDGAIHLFARRCQYPLDKTALNWRNCTNDLAIFRLTSDLDPILMIVPEPPNRYPKEQWEDPRAFVADGKLFVSMCTYIPEICWTFRQSLVEMRADLSAFSVAHEPEFGGNHPELGLGTGNEKNWTWFTTKTGTFCVYTLNPLVIFLVSKSTDKWVSTPDATDLPWQRGTLRGGTNPELVDGEYLTFFHSSLPWENPSTGGIGRLRRYYMGALTFTSKPPFRITAITPKPLLVGSEEDSKIFPGPPVVFPAGAKLLDGSWLVTMGINDESCAWIRIPHDELKGLMVSV